MMPIGTSRLRVARFLGVGRDRVEADVGEEDYEPRRPSRRAARRRRPCCPMIVFPKKLMPGIAVGREGVPIGGIDVEDADER